MWIFENAPMKSYYLRAARSILGKSLSDIAQDCGLSRATIHRLETKDDIRKTQSNSLKVLVDFYKKEGIDVEVEGIIVLSEFEELIKQ